MPVLRKYIESITSIIKEKGVPNLSPYQFERLMKLLALEYHYRALESRNKEHLESMNLFQISMKISKLSGNLAPEELLDEMIRLSKH